MRAWTQEFDAITKLHFVHDTPKFGFHETKFCGVPEERRVLEPLLQGGDTGHLLRLSMDLPNCRDSAVEFCQNLTGR